MKRPGGVDWLWLWFNPSGAFTSAPARGTITP
jgi:hypothetical protein